MTQAEDNSNQQSTPTLYMGGMIHSESYTTMTQMGLYFSVCILLGNTWEYTVYSSQQMCIYI